VSSIQFTRNRVDGDGTMTGQGHAPTATEAVCGKIRHIFRNEENQRRGRKVGVMCMDQEHGKCECCGTPITDRLSSWIHVDKKLPPVGVDVFFRRIERQSDVCIGRYMGGMCSDGRSLRMKTDLGWMGCDHWMLINSSEAAKGGEEVSKPSMPQCPGGSGCTCCGSDCDCGCIEACPVYRKWDRVYVSPKGKRTSSQSAKGST
jgi:hypothetical protein